MRKLNLFSLKFQSIENIFNSLPLFQIVSFLLIMSLIFIKNPYLYIYPVFIPDDVHLFVNHFNRIYNLDNQYSFYFFYGNAFLFIPNLFATIFIATLPLEWVPRAFAIFSLVITTTVSWLFCLRPFSVLVSSRLTRLIICVLLTIQPIGSFALQTGLLWQSWNLTILIILFIIIEPFIDNKKWLLIVPIIIISIFSTQASIIFLPWFMIKGIRLLYAKKYLRFSSYFILSACTLINFFCGLNFEQYGMGSLYSQAKLHTHGMIKIGLLTFFPRVFFEGFFSLPLRMILGDMSPMLPFLFSFLIFLTLCVVIKLAYKKNPNILEFALFVCYIIISITLLSTYRLALHREIVFQEKGLRYFYVQKFFLLLLFSICTYQLIMFLNIRIKAMLTIIIFALAIGCAANDNYRRFFIFEDLSYHQYQEKISKSEKFIIIRDEGIKFANCLSRVQQIFTLMKENNQSESHFCCKELKNLFEIDLINNKDKE